MRARAILLGCLLTGAAGAQELVIAEDAGAPLSRSRPLPRRPEPLDVVSVFGLRGSMTRAGERDAVAGLQLGGGGVAYDRRGSATLRATHFAQIGGGTGGVEGGIGLAYAAGLLGELGRGHGPVARFGGRAHLLGNDELYASLVELPEVQLGYQLLARRLHLELAARTGAVLVGRYNPEGGRRPLGKAFEWGALAALRVEGVHLDLEWMRIEARSSDPDTPVDVLSGLLCAAASPLALCLDARRYTGDVRAEASDARRVTSTYLGLTAGWGTDL
jgi:hypothetical protein